jgi:hypothetical protein
MAHQLRCTATANRNKRARIFIGRGLSNPALGITYSLYLSYLLLLVAGGHCILPHPVLVPLAHCKARDPHVVRNIVDDQRAKPPIRDERDRECKVHHRCTVRRARLDDRGAASVASVRRGRRRETRGRLTGRRAGGGSRRRRRGGSRPTSSPTTGSACS